MTVEQRRQNQAVIDRLRIQQNYLKNPRFRSAAASASFDAPVVSSSGGAADGLCFTAEPAAAHFNEYVADGR
jgi:hypothetical protein